MSGDTKKGMLRPVGIIVFAFVMALLFGLFYWVAPLAIKYGVERVGTELNGARVELADVDISLSPAGLHLHDLKVANAKAPMTNLFEFQHAFAELNLFELWGGRVLVEDMAVDALRFDTPRTESGAIEPPDSTRGEALGQKVQEAASEQMARLGGELPNAEDVLARHPLKTDALAKQLRDTIDNEKQAWEELSSNLPAQDRIGFYRQEISKLSEAEVKSVEDFNRVAQQLEALKQTIREDKNLLAQAKDKLSESKSLVAQGYQDLRDAPVQDWKSIQSKYTLDGAGALNLTGLIFGEKIQSYADRTLYWYERIASLLDRAPNNDGEAQEEVLKRPRGMGEFVHFSDEAIPDFLVRRANASAILSAGTIAITAQDLTHQQEITGRPSRLNAQASELKDLQKLDLNVEINHVDDISRDRFDLAMLGQAIDNVKLSESDSLPVELASAGLDLDVSLSLIDRVLDGQFAAEFNNASIKSEGKTTFAKEVSSLLASIESFDVSGDLKGSLSSPDVGLRSNLDGILGDAFKKRFNEKRKEWESKVKAELSSKLNAELASLDIGESYFGDQASLIDGDISELDALLQTQVDSYVDKQKEDAKKKLDNKLQEKLKGLF